MNTRCGDKFHSKTVTQQTSNLTAKPRLKTTNRKEKEMDIFHSAITWFSELMFPKEMSTSHTSPASGVAYAVDTSR